MKEFQLKSDKILDDRQKEFIVRYLKESLNIESITFTESQICVLYKESIHQVELQKSIDQAIFISKSINKEIIFENRPSIQFGGDPQPELEKIKDVIRIADGFFAFQGLFLKVFHAINRQIKRTADELNAIEQEYPTVWPIDLYKKINYFFEFPQQVILCATVKNEFEVRKKFAEKYSKDKPYTTIEMDSLFEKSSYGLESAVCDCCYYSLAGTRDQPNAFYTCYNKVFRNENSPTKQLDRLTNFTVRDIMFVGEKRFALESRQILIDKLSEFLSSLHLNCKIETANDPFFMNKAAMKSVFQNSNNLKYELLAAIPHQKKDLAVGSINYHMDMFSSAFEIKVPSGSLAHSGCIGIGMERLAFALYCQHGVEVSCWPEKVRSFLEVS